MTRLGLAVVGAGMAAKPHALALQALRDKIDVRGVFARSPERRAAFCAEYGFPEAADLETLAGDPSVGAVLILTPPNARREVVALFANKGKAVLTEKPVERSLTAAEDIVSICQAAGVPLGVVLQHRFRAASEELSRKMASGELGALRAVRVDVPWWRGQAYYDEPGRGSYARDGGGVLISQAIHTLDLMLSLTGAVTSVMAQCATTGFHTMESEDFVAGGMLFEGGIPGSLFATTAAYPGDAESIRLDCANASVLLKSGTLTIDWQDGRQERFGETADTGGGADPMAFPFDWHRDLIADFADAVLTGRSPRVTGQEALKVHRLIAAIERSSREGRRIDLRS